MMVGLYYLIVEGTSSNLQMFVTQVGVPGVVVYWASPPENLRLNSGLRYEAGLIRHIIQEISTQLDRTPLYVAKYPVGIDSRVQELQTILNLQFKDDILMVGLWGQGGVGKTTIAKAIYNTILREFQGSSFLDQVRENSKSSIDLVHLQKKLLSQVLRKELTIFSVNEGSQLIQDRLCNKKVLIILDDVDDERQLNALAGDCEWYGSGSRIIITTRNKHLLASHGVDSDHLYKVKVLEDGEALELFRKHAFLRSQKIKIRSNLVDSVLHYAKGLPLALEVLGSFLCGRGEHQWESTLGKLAKSPHKKINDVLKVSYEGLEDYVKEIFLDIACFFKGLNIDYIKSVLDSCDFDTTIGLQILIERSLISEERGALQMHDSIQLMGMDIVKEECRDDSGKRNRLWLYDDVLDVLSGDALRWFEWPNCALIPEFGYGPNKLVGLDMRNSKIKEVPKQFKAFIKLKFINFSGCESLVCMPNLDCTPNLEILDLCGCKNLGACHESISYHNKLQILNLDCSKLQRLPDFSDKNERLARTSFGRDFN
ncbi:hypothetical protein EUGRSUZ_H01770 [Eucalyptus grandis]|uniref:Uncharacterized protein n=2 Tax=Eucalyptus grandis TaxID=71139 RepID=A0ACC3JQX2_EUCGR|nr:hypothetical protein EUGRSUZ_H01770 [Eucalyptus grandis]